MAYRQKESHKLERHHRKCRSHGGTNEPRNISIVRENLHRAYHLIFQNRTAEEVADVLNDIWIDPDKVLICVDRVDAETTQLLLKQLARLSRR